MTVRLPTRPHLPSESDTERATGWVALLCRNESPVSVVIDARSRPDYHAALPLDGLTVPDEAFVAASAEELVEHAPGSGYLFGRVAARVENGEVVEVVGTIDANPQATDPEPAMRAAAALGLEARDPVLHMRMVGFGGVGHGGIDTRGSRFVVSEWAIDTSPRWVRRTV